MVRVSKEVMPQNQSVEAEEVGGDGSLKHKHPTLDPTKPFTAVSRTQVGKQGEVVHLQIRGYDRGQYDGWWVTEYTRHGSRTIHCLPSSHLNALSGPLPTPEKARALANFPILQRWVGVQYHPEAGVILKGEGRHVARPFAARRRSSPTTVRWPSPGAMTLRLGCTRSRHASTVQTQRWKLAHHHDITKTFPKEAEQQLLQAVFVDKTRALDIDMTASTPLPVSAALNEAGAGLRTSIHARTQHLVSSRLISLCAVSSSGSAVTN